ncbi:MAG: DUF4347 domain-containing protein, partial [Aeoliella sp.]
MPRKPFWQRISRYTDQHLARIAGPLRGSPRQSPDHRVLDVAMLEDRVLFSAAPLGALVDVDVAVDVHVDADLAEAPDFAAIHDQSSSQDSYLFNPSHSAVGTVDQDAGVASEIEATEDEAADPDETTLPVLNTDETVVRHELIFVDTATSNYQQLLDDLWSHEDPQREFDVFLISAERDGVEQITATLASYDEVDAIHIVSHGTDGAVQLGNTWLRAENVTAYTDELVAWKHALSQDADLLFYGCELAGNDAGAALVESISALCDCDVAASVDDTGHELLGGDWQLEYATGSVETGAVFTVGLHENWIALLNLETFQEGTAAYSGTVDTTLRGELPDTSYGTDNEVQIDLDDGGAPEQGLIRFDNIFGSGASQIPYASTINSVSLKVEVTNEAGSSSAAVTLHRMLASWDETSTWNSMVGGLQTDDVEVSSTVDATLLNPDVLGTHTITGLESTVQAWSDGATNYGWAIFSDDTNGLDFSSSEEATIALRPQLIVDFTPSTNGVLWLSTDSNVGAPGADGLPSGWGEDQILEFGGVDLAYGAVTDGDLSFVMDFDPFALDPTDLGALHYVSRDITVGSGADTFDLQQGDLLVSFHQDETILAAFYETGSDTLVHDHDVLVLRPTIPGDYTDGTFYMLLDDIVPADLRGISLVERATTVGDARLDAGTFILAQETAPSEDIYHFVPSGVGAGPKTSGTLSTLVDGSDINIDTSVVRGVELIESATLVGGQVLPAGSILVSLRDDEPSVGDNNLPTARQDLFLLDVSTTGVGMTAGDAYMFLDGSDVNLDETPGTENPYAIALINGAELVVDTANDVLDAPDTTSIAALLADKGTDGRISLREAMEAADATANGAAPDQIHFDIAGSGPHVIQLDAVLGALPAIIDPVVIDGSTEPDYAPNAPVVRVDGNNLSGAIDGFSLDSTSDGSTIRGLMITRMPRHGIFVASGGDTITIAGNWIGTDGTASPLMGNGNDGIDLRGSNATIGGVGPNDRNVITNSADEGINIVGTGVTNHTIQGNYIGINPDGTSGSGNADVGIAIISGSGNTIGGTAAEARNVISNNFEGIEINTDNNIVRGNYIGTDPTGAFDRGNRSDDGIEIQSGADGNRIGGIGTDQGNLIAFNALTGVNVASGTGNSVLGNEIHSNSGIGINLDSGGVDLNDPGDGDPGANNLLNFPVIYSSVISGFSVTITGEARPGATVEFFEADNDGSGHGEGESFIGRNTVSGSTPGTDDPTARQFSFVFAVGSLLIGDEVTATATDAGNNTSEFSLNFTATGPGNVPPTIGLPGGPLNYTENDPPTVIDPGGTVLD